MLNEEVKSDETNRLTLFVFLFTSQTAYAEFDIQFAIDRAKAGDSIHIPAGRYQGNFIVRKPIELYGHKGTELYSQNDEPALKIDHATNVSIENIRIIAKIKELLQMRRRI